MLAPGRGLLATFRFPRVPERFIDAGLDGAVERFKEIVSTIRNLRQSFNIAPGTPVPVVISCERGRGLDGVLGRFREPMRTLARIADLEIGEALAKPPGSAAAGLAGFEIYVPLAGIVDIDVERARLQRELEKITRDSGKIAARLGDSRFVERAPAEVVEQERRRFDDMADRKTRVERILEDLG